jgi:hypothetical protein
VSWLRVAFAKPFDDVPPLVRAEAIKQLDVLANTLRAAQAGSPLRQKYTGDGIYIDVGGWRFLHRLAGDQVVVYGAFLINGG